MLIEWFGARSIAKLRMYLIFPWLARDWGAVQRQMVTGDCRLRGVRQQAQSVNIAPTFASATVLPFTLASP